MTVSVVLPYYNREGCLENTLESILQQSYRPFTLILVDNNSTDRSADIVKQWAAAHNSDDFRIVLANEHCAGAAAARNRGLDLVETPWVAFFDSDDLMHPDFIKTIVDNVNQNPEASIITWPVTDSRGTTHISRHNHLFNNIIHGTLSTQRYAVKTSLIRIAGLWNQSVRVWDDMELGCRLLSSPETQVVVLDTPLVRIIESTDSITSRSNGKVSPEKEHALNICSQSLKDNQRALRWVDLRRVQLAAEYHRNGFKEDAQRLLQQVLEHRSRLWKLLYYKHFITTTGTYLFAPFTRRC